METIAVMAKYNPFFEKAGMTKIAETTPNPQILKTVEKMKKFNFNPVFLTSEKANLNKLQNMTKKQLEAVRTVIKGVTGIYRKRVAGTKKAFLNNQEYGAIIDAADTAKLAKMIRILGFLTQTKVYLFWKNRQKKSNSDLVVSAHLRYKANILVNNLLLSLLVCDAADQGAQTKCATFHFVSTQSNRLKPTLFKQRSVVSTYKYCVAFRQKTTTQF